MRIEEIKLREIYTSNAARTLEVEMFSGGQPFRAQIPAGESRGSGEAKALTPEEAAESWAKLRPQLLGLDFRSVSELDQLLLHADGTPDKSKFGGNVILGVSLAGARALASEEKKELWQSLAEEFFPGGTKEAPPRIYANFVEGGAHAQSGLALQEYLVISDREGPLAEKIALMIELYRKTGGAIGPRLAGSVLPLGVEGGYAVNWRDDLEPLSMLEQLISDTKAAAGFRLGLDAAASNFFRNGRYRIGGGERSAEELAEVYAGYFGRVPALVAIEDPFAENDPASFAALRVKFPDKLIIGDDLTTTNPFLIEQYAGQGAMNGVIIKANQIGTVSETCKALALSKKLGLARIVSHRGEETGDAFLVHLAKASGAEGVKIGAPIRERILKYNELLRLYS